MTRPEDEEERRRNEQPRLEHRPPNTSAIPTGPQFTRQQRESALETERYKRQLEAEQVAAAERANRNVLDTEHKGQTAKEFNEQAKDEHAQARADRKRELAARIDPASEKKRQERLERAKQDRQRDQERTMDRNTRSRFYDDDRER